MLKPSQPFVLLHHRLSDKVHWDLCLDTGQMLATWQILRAPRPSPDKKTHTWPASRIADHRRAYLEYEGQISGGRGEVRRVDAGVWIPIEQGPTEWVVRLEGAILNGVYRLPGSTGPGEMCQMGLDDGSEGSDDCRPA